MNELIERIDWDKGAGLVPAVVQDADTLRVLMLGYMSREALERTLRRGHVTFFSRSRQRLWEKGESSGNVLDLVAVELDCDADALLVRARPHGPTCHRGTTSCFDGASKVAASASTSSVGGLEEAAAARAGDGSSVGFLAELGEIIAERATAAPDISYTRRLLDAGVLRVAQKVGEEGVEVALAATQPDRASLCGEAADLLYHLLVLLRARGLSLSDVTDLLRARHVRSRRRGLQQTEGTS